MAAVLNKKNGKKEKTLKHIAEPIKNLCVSKRKLDRVETERIYRVIQVGCKNIGEAKALQAVIKDDKKIFSISNNELRNLVLNHQLLINNLDKNNEESDDVKLSSIKFSLHSVLRCLHFNALSLEPHVKDESFLEKTDIDVNMEALKEVIHEKLLTDVEDEKLRNSYLLQIMEQARNSHKIINHLNDVLTDKTAEKEHLLNKQDLKIRTLKRSLDQMISSAGEENNTTLNDAAKQILTEQKTLENKQKKLQQDIVECSESLHKERKTNYLDESKLRKRKFKMAGELHNWIVKYDQDLGWRQDQIDEITELHNQDLEEISQMQLHFIELEKEYDAIIEERRLEKEDEIKKEEMQALKRRAVVKIQAIFRGWFARENIKKKKAGNKPTKKGGKKK